jgi:hypothetical protein
VVPAVAVLVLLTGTPKARPASEQLQLAVNPKFSYTPGSFRATARVERDGENRSLTLSAESRDYYRSSTVQLDGADAARSHFMVFEGLPSGRYLIRAQVERADGRLILRDCVVMVGTTQRR